MSDGLFELPATPIEVGDPVRVQTIYGLETGVVVEKGVDPEGFPIVSVDTRSGDRITIGVGRVRPG